MADHPILFSAPMVRALLEGRKTQTRRVLKPQPYGDVIHVGPADGEAPFWMDMGWDKHKLPTWIGDRLWVRESYYQRGYWQPVTGVRTRGGQVKWQFVPIDDVVLFELPAGNVRLGRHHKDPGAVVWHKRLGRFMPRRYSRLTLTVTNVRVERLQDISEADAIAEGIFQQPCDPGPYLERAFHWLDGHDPAEQFVSARFAYRALWNAINGSGSWEANPWVAAYTFTVERRNIDEATP